MKRVEAYRNLHKPGCVWSIRSCMKENRGRVIGYSPIAVIDNAEFIVQPAGRARVLREKRKHVHAFVRGDWRSEENPAKWLDWFEGQRKHCNIARYNPFKHGAFVDNPDEENPTEYISHWRAICWEGRVYLADSYARSISIRCPNSWHSYTPNPKWVYKVA